ncbi:uncharacterized protein GLRG_07368 [Colletotrichum graminicola M1.001]|uniref:Uncharacterized protein n=1 Tax=Colletotrichum graminicola (strain M1.001 / M2 / FGSC 10212) TaxID=645133 RepID=E3QMY6_COLGM|nr:uncharacterized protein GLRG_07368 [Colletotrichum graminicola M1.001]EFQ32224.1 hypothetical protein GLRG_07368 [Colletotrichum graminicola M1.001]
MNRRPPFACAFRFPPSSPPPPPPLSRASRSFSAANVSCQAAALPATALAILLQPLLVFAPAWMGRGGTGLHHGCIALFRVAPVAVSAFYLGLSGFADPVHSLSQTDGLPAEYAALLENLHLFSQWDWLKRAKFCVERQGLAVLDDVVDSDLNKKRSNEKESA